MKPASSVSLRTTRPSWLNTSNPLAPVSSGVHRVCRSRCFFSKVTPLRSPAEREAEFTSSSAASPAPASSCAMASTS